MITLKNCIDAWNSQADRFNQWDELDADERCEWCLKLAQPEDSPDIKKLDPACRDCETYRRYCAICEARCR